MPELSHRLLLAWLAISIGFASPVHPEAIFKAQNQVQDSRGTETEQSIEQSHDMIDSTIRDLDTDGYVQIVRSEVTKRLLTTPDPSC